MHRSHNDSLGTQAVETLLTWCCYDKDGVRPSSAQAGDAGPLPLASSQSANPASEGMARAERLKAQNFLSPTTLEATTSYCFQHYHQGSPRLSLSLFRTTRLDDRDLSRRSLDERDVSSLDDQTR